MDAQVITSAGQGSAIAINADRVREDVEDALQTLFAAGSAASSAGLERA